MDVQSHSHVKNTETKMDQRAEIWDLNARLNFTREKIISLDARIVAFEVFINEGLKTGAWNSTIATELLKKT